MRASLIAVCFLVSASLIAGPQLNINPGTHQYELQNAFLKVLPQNEVHEILLVLALGEADFSTGPVTALIQVLRSKGMATLESFLAQLSAKVGSAFVSSEKLTPSEMAEILSMYRMLDADTNTLLSGMMVSRYQTRLANDVAKLTTWPWVPIREHGVNEREPFYNIELWKSAYEPFKRNSLNVEFLLIRAMLVNFESGHNTYHSVTPLRQAFFKHLQQVALKDDDPHLAKQALLAYLSNTKTDAALETMKHYPSLFPDIPSVKGNTLAAFVYAFSQIDSHMELRRFFSRGHLRNRIPVDMKLQTLAEVVEFFQKNPKDILFTEAPKSKLTELARICLRVPIYKAKKY